MSQWLENWKRPPTSSGWKITTNGFHLAAYDADRLAQQNTIWAEADNVAGANANTNRMAIRTPLYQGFGISVSWKFWVRFGVPTATEGLRFWLMSRDENVGTASNQGYEVSVLPSVDLTQMQFRLSRWDGAGAQTVISGPTSITMDAIDHEVYVTREVSGANRFWRVYTDSLLVQGPTNDATYTVGTFIGIGADRRMCNGPIVLQW